MKVSVKPMGIKLKTKEYPTIATGLVPLDEVLLGGFRRDSLIHFYGDPVSGKTTFAMQILVNILKQGWRGLWVDCNGAFSLPRFQSLLGDQQGLIKNFALARPSSFQHQTQLIQYLQYQLDRVGIIVVDPITHFYRVERFKEGSQGFFQELVGTQLSTLMGISHLQQIPTIVINYATLHKLNTGTGFTPIEVRQPLVEQGFERVEKYRLYFQTVQLQATDDEDLVTEEKLVTIERAPEKFSQGRTLTFRIGPQGIHHVQLVKEEKEPDL